MNVLVTYATKTGCTTGVAERIGEVLAESGATVDVVPASARPDASAYDAVVVGSGVRAGNWHGDAKSWVDSNAAALKERPVAFFTVGLTMASEPEKADEVRAYTDPVIEKSGVTPVDVGLFAGWFEPKEFGFVSRNILKKLGALEGDYRDWKTIEAWTRDMAGKLGA